MKKHLSLAALSAAILAAPLSHSAEYMIDKQGAHAFIQFKIQHLGYSWLLGRFNDFDGTFNYDPAKPEASSVMVNINPASIDSNHAERDKHLKGKDFLDVSAFPKATFVSTKIVLNEDKMQADIYGNLTLKGVTKEIKIEADKIGEGQDPWGGYRAGFEGEVTLKLKDFNINYNLGPASETVQMELYIEGIKK